MRTSATLILHALLPLLLIPASLYTVNAQCPASSPLVINSITSAESRCAASGSATVSASGGSAPYTYSITAGPSTDAAQSSNVLQSLEPGTYTVQVTDNCGTSVTGSVTIAGTYTIPAPTFSTTSTSCPGSSDGSITVSVAGGRAPLTYALVSPSPVTAAAQASNVFTGLPAGTYYSQVGDSCGNIQTRTVTVAAGSSTVNLSTSLQYVSCNTYTFTLSIDVSDPANFKPPFTNTVTLPNGTVMTRVLTPTVNPGTITDTYTFTYVHKGGVLDPITATATNNCGVSQSSTFDMGAYLDMHLTTSVPSGCNPGYVYTFDQYDNSTGPSPYHCGTLTYTLVSPAGVVLATQTNNSTFSGYPAGNGYKVIRQDCCSAEDTLTFNWAAPAATLQIEGYVLSPQFPCNAGLATIWMYFNDVNTYGDIYVESGPPSVTFGDGTVHTYTYPMDIPTGFAFYGEYINGFGVGTYKLVAVDVCGNTDSINVTIAPSDVRQDVFSATAVKGCSDQDQIKLNATTTAAPYPMSSSVSNVTFNGSVVENITQSPYSASVAVGPGTYAIAYNYQGIGDGGYLTGMDSYSCDVIYDTLVIPAYTQPAFAAAPAIANCGSTRDVALLPDSTSGVSPYEFQIIAGPTTTVAQSSPVFPGLSAGTYTFQMTDACGNSYSSNISIDTLAVPAITTSGGTCAGGAATFTLPASPFYTYTWQLPNGATSTGDTLSVSPVTVTDTGTYTITVTSTVGGCASSSSKTVSLAFCAVLAETALDFTGKWIDDTIRLSWQSTDLTGIRYYTVERSADGITFEPIQELPATAATDATAARAATTGAYSATDTHPPSGTVFYRLQLTDKSGNVTYSQTLSFSNANTQPVNVYPRLITGNTTVSVTYPQADGSGFIRVIGVDGTIYRTYAVPAGSTQSTIDVAGLAQGAWFITYTGNGIQTAIEVWKE